MKTKVSFSVGEYGLYLILLTLIIISGILSPLFFTYQNIANLLTQCSFIGLLSIGMTFVILIGGIDLSVGSVVGFSSILYASILHGSVFTFMPGEIFIYTETPKLTPLFPLPFDILFVLLGGVIIGFISGFISFTFKIHSFIITLAMMIFIRGLGICYTHGQPLFGVPDIVSYLAYGQKAYIPMPTIIWASVSFLSFVFLKYTRFGRRIYAVGGDEEAARLSGIQPGKYRVFPYIISSFLAALAGIIMTGRMGCGDPKIAQGWELDAIAAVVIGGTSLSGGKGSIGGTIVGVLIMGLITNIMNLLEIEAYPQQMAKGIIIIIALAMWNLLFGKRYR